ncbi:hypothetical protein K2X33_06530 [bacterium]|nr:hypothetical protein [bacterium]
MKPLFLLARHAWFYRNEYLSMIRMVAEMRKSARDFTREYIRKRVKEGLAIGLSVVLFQVTLLLGALLLVTARPSLLARLSASTLLWAITLYNLHRFFAVTVPELKALRKTLRGKSGYALRYLLRISLVTELLQWNLLLPALCLGIALFTRSALGTGVSYFAPWLEAFRVP